VPLDEVCQHVECLRPQSYNGVTPAQRSTVHIERELTESVLASGGCIERSVMTVAQERPLFESMTGRGGQILTARFIELSPVFEPLFKTLPARWQ
jgi:hypothetical protein